LLNLEKIKHKVDKEKVYEFYFMHYKYSGYSQLFFKSFEEYILKHSVDEQNSSMAYEYFLNEIIQEGDALICNKIDNFIESGDYRFYA
jgi:hypothetical protein